MINELIIVCACLSMLIDGSSPLNGCHQNEGLTADKNIKITHKSSTQLRCCHVVLLHENPQNVWNILSCKLCLICAYFSPASDSHWRKQQFENRTHILAGSNGLKLKMHWWISFLQTPSFSLHKILRGLLAWFMWLSLSAVWTLILTAPIHAEDPLVSKVMQC